MLVDPQLNEERVMEGRMVVGMNKHREICTFQMTGSMLLLKDQVSRTLPHNPTGIYMASTHLGPTFTLAQWPWHYLTSNLPVPLPFCPTNSVPLPIWLSHRTVANKLRAVSLQYVCIYLCMFCCYLDDRYTVLLYVKKNLDNLRRQTLVNDEKRLCS